MPEFFAIATDQFKGAGPIAEKRSFIAKWPYRTYSLDERSVDADCGNGGSCEVKAKVAYAVRSDSGKSTSGTGIEKYRIEVYGGENFGAFPFRIFAENESILSRDGKQVGLPPKKSSLSGWYGGSLQDCQLFATYELVQMSRP